MIDRSFWERICLAPEKAARVRVWRRLARAGPVLLWLLPTLLPVPTAASGVRSHAPGPYEVQIDRSPPPIGLGRIVVHVRDRQTGQPVSDGSVMVKASMPAMPMGETYHTASATPGRPGEYQLSWPFQMAGDWVIRAEVKGPEGVSDAAVHVSPGALAVPVWAEIVLGLIGLVILVAIVGLAGTRNGRERLKTAAQKKNLIALMALVAVIAGAWLLVRRVKSGQTDWNRMSMTMADYTAPTPVSIQPVKYGSISGVITYTGTVAPYVEDTIYARVTGRIVRTRYAGDTVTAGEVVAQLDEPDIAAKAEEARFATVSAGRDVLEAKDKLRQAQDAVAIARAALQASAGGVQEAGQNQIGAGGSLAMAEGDLQAANEARSIARADLTAAHAAVQQSEAQLQTAQANAAYWKAEIPREASLLSHGAVSQDEYESELAKSQVAQAAVNAAQADRAHAKAGVETAEASVRQSAAKIQAARAQVIQARAAQGGEAAKVSEAHAAEHGAGANLASAIHGAALSGQQVGHAYAMLNQARAAQAQAEAQLGYLTIHAPESGVVAQRLADPGTVVSPGEGILIIDQIDRVRLQASVSADDLNKIHVGTPVLALVQGVSEPITARVTTIFPSANPTTRTDVVEAVVPNPGKRLTPGQFVTLQFHIAPAKPSLMVPASAVVSLAVAGGAGASSRAGAAASGVWLAVNSAAHLQPVTLGPSDGVNQEVLSGLKSGDLVIVSGAEGLTEGAPVTYPGMPQFTPSGVSSQPETPASSGGLTARAGDFTLALSFDPSPPRAGDETLRFTVTDSRGTPVKGASLEIATAMPSMSMNGPSGAAHDNRDGTYTLPIVMGMGAEWRVTVSITPPGVAANAPASHAVFNVKVR